ncbi:hypothetical protein Tco_1162871 [Tanacetum coccineum]
MPKRDVTCLSAAANCRQSAHTELMSQWNDVTQQLEELKQRAEELGQPVDALGQADALQRQADALKRQADELEQRGNALEERVLALKRRFNALGERVSQYLPRLNFFVKMYKEHKLKNEKNKTYNQNFMPAITATSSLLAGGGSTTTRSATFSAVSWWKPVTRLGGRSILRTFAVEGEGEGRRRPHQELIPEFIGKTRMPDGLVAAATLLVQ